MKAGGKQALGARETAPDYFTLGCSFALEPIMHFDQAGVERIKLYEQGT